MWKLEPRTREVPPFLPKLEPRLYTCLYFMVVVWMRMDNWGVCVCSGVFATQQWRDHAVWIYAWSGVASHTVCIWVLFGAVDTQQSGCFALKQSYRNFQWRFQHQQQQCWSLDSLVLWPEKKKKQKPKRKINWKWWIGITLPTIQGEDRGSSAHPGRISRFLPILSCFDFFLGTLLYFVWVFFGFRSFLPFYYVIGVIICFFTNHKM